MSYIEHDGHKVVLSIALETVTKGFKSTMFVGQATDMPTLINELDRVKVEHADAIRAGALIVTDIQDYVDESEYKRAYVEYIVRDADELDVFDDYEAYLETDGYFYVLQQDSGEKHYPIWCVRQNGDIDGFEGWSDTPCENMP